MNICRSQFDQLRNRSGCKLHCKNFIVPDIPSGTERNAPDQKQYSQNPKNKGIGFLDFEQRSYDMNELENQLLENTKSKQSNIISYN